MIPEQHIVYCWRYENLSYCKIGKSSLNIFLRSRLKEAERVNILDIEILGICRCTNKEESHQLEKHLLNERFDRVRPDRNELVHFNSKVKDWLEHDSVEKNWTIEKLNEIPNPYAPTNTKRQANRNHENRRKADLKTRAQNIYERELLISGPARATFIVATDLQKQGADYSLIEECLDELGKHPNSTDNN